MILTIKNAIPDTETAPDDGVAGRIVRRSLAKREGEYAGEVRRLLDAALEVMHDCGTSARPRVADIVQPPGSPTTPSTGTFALRTTSSMCCSRMAPSACAAICPTKWPRHAPPRRRSAAGSRASSARPTATSPRDAGGAVERQQRRRWRGRGPALCQRAARLPAPRALHRAGHDAPEFDAALAADATLGLLSDCLWRSTAPSRAEQTASSTSACGPSGADPSVSPAAPVPPDPSAAASRPSAQPLSSSSPSEPIRGVASP